MTTPSAIHEAARQVEEAIGQTNRPAEERVANLERESCRQAMIEVLNVLARHNNGIEQPATDVEIALATKERIDQLMEEFRQSLQEENQN